ncbi:JAB domain-containing protein [Lachnoclostridium pacaense]|uniref:JAB domain-containing protein n=1 Tax=Enterocloster hominis (ex Hitch et al. 2024) TaxID=1917870 RepID=UPI001D10211F|nr:JAB domain-containing protein [Lachnoclostridium pacaense]MCC2819746.1 JAB domain-containing protein [Lachnoclostridium pacaense]
MLDNTQKEQMEGMMKRPIPKKKIGIIRLRMVKESSLYGMKRFSQPWEAVELVRPLFDMADREMVVVMSLSTKLEPLALEVAAVGGINACSVDVRDIFKHSLLNNVAYVVCFHNHPSGDPEPSQEDKLLTKRIEDSGRLLGIPLIDHIIVGESGFYSFRQNGLIHSTEPDNAA